MPAPKIIYDPTRAEGAGYYDFIEDRDKPPASKDKKRLLNLLWWLVYTREGRTFMHETREPYLTDQAVRDALRDRFAKQFGIIDEALQNALIEGHIAAVRWLIADKQMPNAKAQVDRDTQEKIYQHYMGFVMWSLWEDAMNVEFSALW
jgi:hypothetical protein